MIKPTVGRIVWYWTGKHAEGVEPRAAIIARVWNDHCINAAVFDQSGNAGASTSLRLLAEGEEVPDGPHCTWMPYQTVKAASPAGN